ncbi:hypothetical protein EDB89DRAFT_1954771 [Lactarius sanguifluus]|nr:hypothetical protein EDB89DRAFT_1954771 [Lactarius sanguifluus]
MSRLFYSLSLRMVSSTLSSDVCALRLPKRFCGVKGEQRRLYNAASVQDRPKIRPKPSITELDVQHGFISRSSYKRSDSQRL